MKPSPAIHSAMRAAHELLAALTRSRLAMIPVTASLLLLVNILATAQSHSAVDTNAAPTPTPTPILSGPPLTEREQQMMEMIKDLQERLAKVEKVAQTAVSGPRPLGDARRDVQTGMPIGDQPKSTESKEGRWGAYTPNLGYRLVDTEYGDMSVSIYTYARYLNQRNLDPTYTDAFGNVKTVQQRQDVQLQKLQIKFLGWIMSPKFRYFLYAWTSNANQGLGAQTVLAGNLSYKFNDWFTLGGGIRSLPGTRSVEGNFPFWTNVDSRHIADEFFRPSYTSGVWATGNIVKDKLRYQVMLGNNMSTLGVPASRLDNGLNTLSSSLIWTPTGKFETNFSDEGWGDFFHHDYFATRFGFHFSRSDENKESQPNSEQFENTQLRLSDGSVIFTPDLFGPGKTISDARWRMISMDGAFKYKGYSLEGEYYLRWLDNFRGTNVDGIPTDFAHGFQLQGTAMLKPKTLQAYMGFSQVYGDYGDPYDFRTGLNFFPFKNKVVRWNNELLYLYKSPVGYTSVAYPVGGRGWVFSSSMELAF